MKKVLAAVGVFAFLLVLLVKPFEFMEVYSEHAGRVTHDVRAEGHDNPAPLASKASPDQTKPFVNALVNASNEAQSFKTSFWLLSLLGIGLVTFALSVQRKKKREKE